MLRVWNVDARHRHVLPDDLRHVHDAVGRRAVGARLRRGPGAGVDVHRVHGGHPRRSASAWVIYRLPLLRRATSSTRGSRARRRSSRTTGSCCSPRCFVLFATMFPTLSEAFTGERLTVGPPFFNRWMLPIGLIAAVPDRRRRRCWRGASPRWRTCCDQFLWPVVCSVVVVGGARRRSAFASGRRDCASRCARSSSAPSSRSSARRTRAPAGDGHRHRHGDDRARGARASAATAATSCTSASS